MVVLFFSILFSLSVSWAFLSGLPLSGAGDTVFFTGLLTLFLGLIMSYNWLGEKPDYSPTAYVVKVQGWGPIVYPRTNPGPAPPKQNSARMIVDLIGLSVIVVGVLLIVVSGALVLTG